MPLAFPSRSHGTVAFGFFNVHTDILLLERYVFFATDFCRAVRALRAEPRTPMSGWSVHDMGDLHGAIAGRALHGLIGATYARWPFPSDPAGFRQQPEGHENRSEVEAMVGRFARARRLELVREPDWSWVSVGPVSFDGPGFAALVAYVDRGGHPRWRDGERPGYVVEMVESCPLV